MLGVFWKILRPDFKELNDADTKLYAFGIGELVYWGRKTESLFAASNPRHVHIFFNNDGDEKLDKRNFQTLLLRNESTGKRVISFYDIECGMLFLKYA